MNQYSEGLPLDSILKELNRLRPKIFQAPGSGLVSLNSQEYTTSFKPISCSADHNNILADTILYTSINLKDLYSRHFIGYYQLRYPFPFQSFH